MGSMIHLQFPEDHFVIPVDKNYLLYLPLKGLIYLLNASALEEVCSGLQAESRNIEKLSKSTISIVEEILQSESVPLKEQAFDKTLELFPQHYLTLDLSSICNLSCVYCYAETGDRGKEFMDFDCAAAAIDLCIQNIILYTVDILTFLKD